MRLESEFIRLPLAFDVVRLREEALQFSEYEWDYHPQRYDGNTALNLVSKEGQRSDSYVGHMMPTAALEQCPYIKQIMASLNTVIGRSRFMRLAPGKDVPPHSDTDYSWRDRVRIHIPIITDPCIRFSSIGNIDVHMQAGEAWIFDNWREHAVYNESDIQRIHLVIDTVGTADFWRMAQKGLNPRVVNEAWEESITRVDFDPQFVQTHKKESQPKSAQELNFERHNLLPVRSPDEVSNMCADFLSEIDPLKLSNPSLFAELGAELKRFVQDWRGLWALHWDSADGIPRYQAKAQELKLLLSNQLGDTVLKSNGMRASGVIAGWLDMTTDVNVAKPERNRSSQQLNNLAVNYVGKIPIFESPVFIVAAPRSGSTMLFEALKNNKEVWTLGDESHREIESINALHPASKKFSSNRLTAEDCEDEIQQALTSAFMLKLQNARSMAYSEIPPEFQPDNIRFLEKTPKNALRIPFFKKMYPDAKFVFLHRKPEPNIGSIIDAWGSKKFVTYPKLPGWQGEPWSLLLSEGWQALQGKPLAQIAAYQWASTNASIIADLQAMPSSDSTAISYEDLLLDTKTQLHRLCEFMAVPFGPKMLNYAEAGFPNSKYAISQPSKDKWRKHEDEIEQARGVFAEVEQQIQAFSKSS